MHLPQMSQVMLPLLVVLNLYIPPSMATTTQWHQINGCTFLEWHIGTLMNIVDGLRLDCVAVGNRTYEEKKYYAPDFPFFCPEICFPRDKMYPDSRVPCRPDMYPGDGFFDTVPHTETVCSISKCSQTYKTNIQVNLYPDRQSVIESIIDDWIELDDADPFQPAYLFNTLDYPTFLSHASFVLGISESSLSGDYGYAVVRIDKERYSTTVLNEAQMTTNQNRVNNFINDLTAAVTDDDVVALMLKYGTHYLKRYDFGDYMLQTFVFTRENYQKVQQRWQQDSGNTNGANFIKYVGDSYSTYVQTVEVGKWKTFTDDQRVRSLYHVCVGKFSDTVNSNLDRTIFKYYENQDYFNTQSRCRFQDYAVTKVAFGSISSLVLTQHPTLKQKWDGILIKTLTHKFGIAANKNPPAFLNQLTYPSSSISFPFYDSFNPALVTHTGSKYSSIYQIHYDLNDLSTDITNPSFVEYMFIMADVIEVGPAPNEVHVPGTATVYIICRQIVSHSTAATHPIIYVNTDDINIIVEDVMGVFRVVDKKTSTLYTYYNNEVYKTIDDVVGAGARGVTVYPPPQFPTATIAPRLYANDLSDDLSTFLHRSFYQGFELAMVSTEIILSLGSNQNGGSVAVECLDWIINSLSQEGHGHALSFELEEILASALLLQTTRVPFYLTNHILVPRLTYEFYKPTYDIILQEYEIYKTDLDAVNSQIVASKNAETIADSQQQINNNIKQIGDLLIAEIETNMKKQEDMQKSYDTLIQLNEQAIADAQVVAYELLNEIYELQDDAYDKGDELEFCVRYEAILGIISAIVNVASTLFNFPPNPSKIPDGISDVAKVAYKVRDVLTGLKQVEDMYNAMRSLQTDLGRLNRDLEVYVDAEGSLEDFPTEAEWNDYDIEIEQNTDPATLPPACAGAAAAFEAASKKISSRGRLFLQTAKDIERLQYEVITLTLQKDIAERHTERLHNISTSLNQASIPQHDYDTANLNDLGFFLQMTLNEVTLDLSRMYVSMDAALQHYYLQAASPFKGFTAVEVVQGTKEQMKKAETALNDFDTPPSEFSLPFIYNIDNVLVDDLFSLAGIVFPIPITDPNFLAYQRVRVAEVRIWVNNLASSTYGNVQVEALASGEFEDRDAHNNIRYFASEPLAFPFIYKIATQQIVLGNRPTPDFAAKYMKITPFTKWNIRINPDSPNNVGLQFSSTMVNIKFELYLIACVDVTG